MIITGEFLGEEFQITEEDGKVEISSDENEVVEQLKGLGAEIVNPHTYSTKHANILKSLLDAYLVLKENEKELDLEVDEMPEGLIEPLPSDPDD